MTDRVHCVVAVFWNLFVAHYREALPYGLSASPPDTTQVAQSAAALTPAGLTPVSQTPVSQTPVNQTPVSQTPVNQSPAGQSPESQSPGAADPRPHSPPQADSVAPRVAGGAPTNPTRTRRHFVSSAPVPFGLNGFYSYMLLLIGLAMCAAAAMDWLKTDDPYPGYGKARAAPPKKTEERLLEDRRELLGDLNELHDEAARKLRNDFRDPVEARQLALSDYMASSMHGTSTFVTSRTTSQKSCSGALGIYRTANREARSTPEPQVWHDALGGRLGSARPARHLRI